MKPSHGEAFLASLLRATKAPPFTREHAFHPERKWRFDICWPQHRLAIEIQGGTRSGGAHTNHDGYTNDCCKLNEAQLLGWRVLWVTSEQVYSGEALDFIERALGIRPSGRLLKKPPGRRSRALPLRGGRGSRRLVLPGG